MRAGFASERTMRRVWQLSPRAEAALLIPALQALGTAAIVTAGGSLVADFWLPGVEPVKFGALCGVVSLGGVWWEGIRDDARRVWYELERRFGIDLDGDGIVGEPEPPRKEPRFQPPDAWVGSKPPGRLKMAYERFPIPFTDHVEAQRVARHVVVHNKPFTRRGLIGSGALPDDPEHYSAIFNAMMEAGLLIEKGNGGIPNDKGREYLAACLAPPPRV